MRPCRLLLISLLLPSLWCRAGEKPKVVPPEQKVLRAHRTAQPPKIDARMDEACWRDAAVAKDFILFKGWAWPTQQTEVRVTYDAEHLYLFATCHESQPDKIKTTTLDQLRDNPVHGDDCLEIFIDRNLDKSTYFHPAISAANVIHDEARPGSHSWNPTWRHATRVGKDAWYAEIAFPFAELAYPGEFQGTAQRGDHWGINFNRNERANDEWSCWSCCHRGFHEPKSFGNIFFEGIADTPLPEVVAADPGKLYLGANAATLTLRNPAKAKAATRWTLELTHGGQRVASAEQALDLAPGGEGQVTLRYAIERGGAHVLGIRGYLGDAAEPFYVGRATFDTPLIREKLADVAASLKASVAKAATFDRKLKHVREVLGQLKQVGAEAKAMEQKLAKPAALSAADWRTLETQANALHERNRALRRSCILLDYQTEMAERLNEPGARRRITPAFCLGAAGPMDKVFPTETYEGSIAADIKLAAARNEFESCQLVVIPLFTELKDVTVWPSDLTHESGHGTIAAANVIWRVVGTVDKERPWHFQGERWVPKHPDPLWPWERFDVPADAVQPIWVTVRVPQAAKPGRYVGHISVLPAGLPAQRVALTVNVWPFAIPRERHLRTDFWFALRSIRRFYNNDRPVPLGMVTRYMDFISQYRLSCMPASWVTLCPRLKIAIEPNGDYSFDFSGIDPYLEAAFARGTDTFNPNFSCGGGWCGWMARPLPALDRKTGKMVKLPTPTPKGWSWTSDEFLHSKIFTQFWQQYVAHLKRRGWLRHAIFEAVDEPNDKSRLRLFQRLHTRMKQIVPELKLMAYGVSPDREGTVGYVDYWAPVLRHYPKAAALIKQRVAKGDRLWLYTCGSARMAGKHTPDIHVIDPSIDRRIIPWYCWKWDVEGYLMFCMNSWGTWRAYKQLTTDPLQRWPLNGEPWKGGYYQFIYPGPDGRPVGSIRLENVRDGLEDYEYLWLLRDRCERLRTKGGDAKLVAEAEKLLVVGPDIVDDAYRYATDPKVLLERRRQIAEAIVRLDAHLAREKDK